MIDQPSPMPPNSTAGLFSSGSTWLWMAVGLGVFIRGIAFYNIQIINPDGALYIYQAKAIASGQWRLLNDCQLAFISLYPFLIALFQKLFSSWVLSAKLVSLVFGVAMLIPLHLMLRQFFTPTVSGLTTLLFAFIPVFVRYSVDAMRDPVYWFFFTMAMWVFLCHARPNTATTREMGNLAAGGVLILLGVLTRIEAVILYPAGCLFILLAHGDHKARRMFAFLAPLMLMAGVGLLVMILAGIDVVTMVRLDAIGRKFFEPFTAFRQLRDSLAVLIGIHDHTLLGEFLPHARRAIWLIVLATILNNIMEAFFYPYLPFVFIGLAAAPARIDRRSAMLFPVLIAGLSFLLLYAHTLQRWIMTYRFVVLLIIPSSVLAGLGIEKTITWLMRTCDMRQARAVTLLVIFIVAVGTAKSGGTIEGDKALYPRIGRQIAHLANGHFPVGVAAMKSTAHQWVIFYANLGYAQPVCHDAFVVSPRSVADLKAWMRNHGLAYFLWEEALWQGRTFGGTPAEFDDDFEVLERYFHPDPGHLVLFRLKP